MSSCLSSGINKINENSIKKKNFSWNWLHEFKQIVFWQKITLGYLRKNLQITIILEEKNFNTENIYEYY